MCVSVCVCVFLCVCVCVCTRVCVCVGGRWEGVCLNTMAESTSTRITSSVVLCPDLCSHLLNDGIELSVTLRTDVQDDLAMRPTLEEFLCHVIKVV